MFSGYRNTNKLNIVHGVEQKLKTKLFFRKVLKASDSFELK